MRVITGTHRGRRLETPQGDDIRPTADHVKEALFNMIQFEIEGAMVLDLFSGTGQLGIETLSRGARQCVFVDSDRGSFELTKRNLTKVGLLERARVVLLSAQQLLAATKDRFDIAFLDPPYAMEQLDELIAGTAAVMAPGGVIVVESSADRELPQTAGRFFQIRRSRYGKTSITLYRAEEM